MRAIALAMSLVLSAGPLAAADHVYVCPMEEHPQEFDHPGKCPLCGMELVEKAARLNVAVPLFDGADVIDHAGPYEVLRQVGARAVTGAPHAEPVNAGLRLAG